MHLSGLIYLFIAEPLQVYLHHFGENCVFAAPFSTVLRFYGWPGAFTPFAILLASS